MSASAIDRTGFSREHGAIEERRANADQVVRGPDTQRLWRDPGLLTFLGSGAVLVTSWLAALSGARELSVAGYLLSTAVGSCLFFGRALAQLAFRRKLTLDLGIGAVIITSVLSGELALGAFLAFVYSVTQVGGGLE